MQPEEAKPTFDTAPGVASVNSIYAYDCGDEVDHKSLKGESLDGTMGWDGEEAAATEVEGGRG